MEGKRALVCGGNGFIGQHLVKRLKKDGYWVRVADIKKYEFGKTTQDETMIMDLRKCPNAGIACMGIDVVFQLAADMGGIGYISKHDADLMHNNSIININVLEAARKEGIKDYFFSSSVCVYPDMEAYGVPICEDEVYPANPDNEYGWEKLFAERVALAYAKDYNMNIKIARFENVYGPECAYDGGREKAPAAICRKVAMAKDGDSIEVWGDGTATRNFVYVDDLVEAIMLLMDSDFNKPVNIGSDHNIEIKDLVNTVIQISKKNINIKYDTSKPVGVKARNFEHAKIKSCGWHAHTGLYEGLAMTYNWINKQIK